MWHRFGEENEHLDQVVLYAVMDSGGQGYNWKACGAVSSIPQRERERIGEGGADRGLTEWSVS